jgi:PAS domain S-box-containing protein
MDKEYFARMEQETGWSKELLYQLVENVKDYAIFVSDLDGTIVSWNIGAEKIFGYTPQEAIGQNCRMLFTKKDQASGEPEKERATAREKGYAEDERWHIRKDDSLFFASGVQTPLYDETGKHTGYAKIARDLTERVVFQEQLEEAKDNLEVTVQRRTGELNKSNESLRTEVVERKDSERLRVALLRKIVSSQEDERKRISREIHDHIGQQIVGLKLKIQSLQEEYKEESKLSGQFNDLYSLVKEIDSEVDFLAWELRPSVLDDLGLTAAIENFAKEWTRQFKIPSEFHHTGLNGEKLLPEIEINLYRILQEALNNVCKHAKATNTSILLERRDGTVNLIIEDDGAGFEPNEKAILTGNNRGLGLLGMKERAELIGGTIEIETSVGQGTTIYARVPARFEEAKT